MLVRQVQAIGTRIDFEETPILFRVLHDPLEVHVVARPPKKEPPRRVSEDRKEAVIHRPPDAIGLSFAGKRELRVNRADGNVKFLENLRGVIERTVLKDVDFRRLEDLKALEPRIDPID